MLYFFAHKSLELNNCITHFYNLYFTEPYKIYHFKIITCSVGGRIRIANPITLLMVTLICMSSKLIRLIRPALMMSNNAKTRPRDILYNNKKNSEQDI